jgi:adenylate kinase
MAMDNLNNQAHQAIYLVVLGPPGSGKGTQADYLQEKYGWLHLSSGDLFRENIARWTELGMKVKDILARGALAPDDLTIRMVMDRLHEPDTTRGVVFDGFPRTRAQAEALQRELENEGKYINRAIYFRIADQAIIDRLSARRVCPEDGAVYNLKSKPPKQDEICDSDGVALIQRDDDKPEVVKKRLEVYRAQTTPVIDFYRDHGLLLEIDAGQDIDLVHRELDKLKALYDNAD